MKVGSGQDTNSWKEEPEGNTQMKKQSLITITKMGKHMGKMSFDELYVEYIQNSFGFNSSRRTCTIVINSRCSNFA
jgi:hypothetical protein